MKTIRLLKAKQQHLNQKNCVKSWERLIAQNSLMVTEEKRVSIHITIICDLLEACQIMEVRWTEGRWITKPFRLKEALFHRQQSIFQGWLMIVRHPIMFETEEYHLQKVNITNKEMCRRRLRWWVTKSYNTMMNKHKTMAYRTQRVIEWHHLP